MIFERREGLCSLYGNQRMDKVGVWVKGIVIVCGADKRQMRY